MGELTRDQESAAVVELLGPSQIDEYIKRCWKMAREAAAKKRAREEAEKAAKLA